MMLQLSPQHGVQTDCVSMVALTEDCGELVCRVYWQGGSSWEIRGKYANVAWIAWTTFWKGHKPMEVQVPCAIIQKLQKNVGARVTGQELNT